MRIADIKIGDRVREDVGRLDDLCRSIEEVGLLQPVVVTPDHALVAGRRRIEAFNRLGRADIPATVVRSLDDALLLFKAECDENLCRKDFTPGEAVALGERLEALEKPKAKERQSQAGPTEGKGAKATGSGKLPEAVTGQTRDKVASAVGMSGKTYEKAKKVVAAAKKNKKLAPVVQKMNETGNVNAAFRALQEVEREEEKEEAVKIAATLPPSDRFEVLAGDFRTSDVEPDSLDCIVTDPPYPEEFVSLYGDLSRFAARTLKPGGSAFVMCGQSYLERILPLLCQHLRYHWTLAYLTPGGQAVQLWDRKVNTFWKPVIWLVKGDYAGDWLGDVSRSEVNDNDKEHHHWGQSESGMADLIERATKPGNLVCDPFMGGGTTGVVAVRLARRFIGIELDQTAADAARVRIHKEVSGG